MKLARKTASGAATLPTRGEGSSEAVFLEYQHFRLFPSRWVGPDHHEGRVRFRHSALGPAQAALHELGQVNAELVRFFSRLDRQF